MGLFISIISMLAMVVSAQQYGVDVIRDGLIDRSEFHWANPDLNLYEEFAKLDLDNDGFIDEDDNVADVTQYGVDVNNDGRIDRAEFHWANPDQDLYEEFRKLDLDNDGFIDQAEKDTNQKEKPLFNVLRKFITRLRKCSKICNQRYPKSAQLVAQCTRRHCAKNGIGKTSLYE